MRRACVVILTSAMVACGVSSRIRSTGTITRGQRVATTPFDGRAVAPSTDSNDAEPAVEPSIHPWWTRFERAEASASFDGTVSFYADSLAGHSTASGEPYDPAQHTAASRTLPFGTVLRLTRPDTGASVFVRVNDRGPFRRRQRVLDLSRSAAEALDMLRRGVVDVHVEVVGRVD